MLMINNYRYVCVYIEQYIRWEEHGWKNMTEHMITIFIIVIQRIRDCPQKGTFSADNALIYIVHEDKKS